MREQQESGDGVKDGVASVQAPPVADPCSHIELIHTVMFSAAGCEECLQSGDSWVTLRLCMICGHVGCCDNSKNKHATRHFHATGHPIIKSFEAVVIGFGAYVDQKLMI